MPPQLENGLVTRPANTMASTRHFALRTTRVFIVPKCASFIHQPARNLRLAPIGTAQDCRRQDELPGRMTRIRLAPATG
jgi:hypothetical protein